MENDNRDAIQKLLLEYRKSTIQSEAEVRSKFIVPLLDVLGYPSELRAEEFPVYGYGGGKKLPAKNADFILFCSPDFGSHRTRTQRNLEWVYDNSTGITKYVVTLPNGEKLDLPINGYYDNDLILISNKIIRRFR